MSTQTFSASRGATEPNGTDRESPAVARHPQDVGAEDVIKVLRDDATLDPKHDPGLSQAEIEGLYRAMVRVRVLDERLVTLQRQGRIGFHIGSLGEEATVLGTAYAMREKDWI